MSVGEQVMASVVLGGYVAVCWLAVRVVFGRRLGYYEWLPVALAAFAVPIMLADYAVASGGGWLQNWLLGGWFGIAVAIDSAWAVCRLCQWLRPRS